EVHLRRSRGCAVLDVVGAEPALIAVHHTRQVDPVGAELVLDPPGHRGAGQSTDPGGLPAERRKPGEHVALGRGDVDVERRCPLEPVAGRDAEPDAALTDRGRVEACHATRVRVRASRLCRTRRAAAAWSLAPTMAEPTATVSIGSDVISVRSSRLRPPARVTF